MYGVRPYGISVYQRTLYFLHQRHITRGDQSRFSLFNYRGYSNCLTHRPVVNVDSKHCELNDDFRRAPRWIGSPHPPYELSELSRDPRSAWLSRLTEHAPVVAESLFCQFVTVVGWTKYRAARQPAQNFAMKHQSSRSAALILGLCPDFRYRIN